MGERSRGGFQTRPIVAASLRARIIGAGIKPAATVCLDLW